MIWVLLSADGVSGVATDLLGFDRIMVEFDVENVHGIGCIAFR